MSSSWTDLARPARGTLGFRLGLWYALLFVAGGVVLTLVTYFLLSSALERRDEELVRSALERYATRYSREGLMGLEAEVASERSAGLHESLFVRVLGAHEEALFVSGPGTGSELDLARLGLAVGPGGPRWTEVSGPSAAFEVATLRLPDGTLLQVGKSSEARADILERFRSQAVLIMATVGLIGVLGGALLTRSALAPVRRLSEALAKIVRTGQVSARVPVRGVGDPLDDLSRLFNEMLDRMDALIAGLRGSLDNVAHDLRTPLARLRATLEAALQAGDPQATRAALEDGLEECDRVASMLTTLMDISEAETGTMALRRERVDAAALLHEGQELYEDAALSKGVALGVEAPAGLFVLGDPGRLRQAVANLVDNAVKYTKAGGHVTLRARAEGSRVVLECLDDGAGIPAEELPRIWDRLYRGDESRSERGLGLGLSLVRAIARAHGGDATVESTPGRGSVFRLALPAPPPFLTSM
jgi:signal transduction histidine kinase